MGKYSHIVDKLPRLLGTEPAYQDKVDAIKTAMAEEPGFLLHASVLAHKYALLREEKAQAQAVLSEIQLRLTATEQLMAAQFEVEATSGLRLNSGRLISIYLEPYSQVTDKEMYRRWCLEQGLERDMVLPWSTTNSLTKKMLEAGEPEPPGIAIYAVTKIRLGSE